MSKSVVHLRVTTHDPQQQLGVFAIHKGGEQLAIHIITGPRGKTNRGDITIDATNLPNPHDAPALRPRDGRDPKVQDWLSQHTAYTQALDAAYNRLTLTESGSATITCSAGKHRSVALAEQLAQRLRDDGHDVTVTHTALKPSKKKNTTAAGYGHNHQKHRDRLLYNLKDGEPCSYCGQPMYRDPSKNFDGAALEADHEQGDKTRLAYRLIHRRCNRSISNDWVEHGPEWYASNGQKSGGDDGGLDWPDGLIIKW